VVVAKAHAGRGGEGEGSFLDRHVGVEVDAGGADVDGSSPGEPEPLSLRFATALMCAVRRE
jgi:hypothetical protein